MDTYGCICMQYVDCQLPRSYLKVLHLLRCDWHAQTTKARSSSTAEEMAHQKSFFHLAATWTGINVSGTYLLANYHKVINLLINELIPLVSIMEPSKVGFHIYLHQTLPLHLRKILFTPSKVQMEDPTTWSNIILQKILLADPSARSRNSSYVIWIGMKWCELLPHFLWRSFSFCAKGNVRDCFKSHVEQTRCKMHHSSDSP